MGGETKRNIIVVWKWGLNPDSGVLGEKWDEWKTGLGDSLIRMDVRERSKWEVIPSTIRAMKLQKVLLFLHNSSPNYLNQEAFDYFSDSLNNQELSSRIILFSGGMEPVYCAKSELGILGIEGRFPFREKVSSDGKVTNASDFVLDKAKRIINQKHFDFIWDFYWFGRRKRILDLAEDFRIWSMGYDVQDEKQPKNIVDYLRQNKSVWYKLSAFLCQSNDDAEFKRYANNYSMQAYTLYLKTKSYSEAAAKLENTQKNIISLIESFPAEEKGIKKVLSDIYNNLIQLYVSLPEDSW